MSLLSRMPITVISKVIYLIAQNDFSAAYSFFAFNTTLTLRRMHANDEFITKLTAMNIGLCVTGIVSQDAL